MPAPPLIHFVTLGRFHNIFVLQFSLLKNGDNRTIYLIGLLQSLNGLIYKKSYEQDPILMNGCIRASLFYSSLECKWSRTFFILCFLPPLPLSLAFLLTQPNLPQLPPKGRYFQDFYSTEDTYQWGDQLWPSPREVNAGRGGVCDVRS